MRQDWRIILPLAIGVALFVSSASAQSTNQQQPIFVQTMTVERSDQAASRQFFGRVAALETVELSFEVPGYLEHLDALEGTRIEAGHLLARLDLAPFERAVERAELALAQAEREVARLNTLATRNVASQVRADDALTARDLAEVTLREARDALEDAQLTAPFDGLVAERIASNFTTISPSQPIVRLHNMSETRIEFDLPERLLSSVRDPSGVAFSAVFPFRDQDLALEFREFQAETGRVGQSYTISLAVVDPDAPILLPGTTVTVRAALTRDEQQIVVPATAITTDPSGQQIVVAVETGPAGLTARRMPVEVRSETGNAFTIDGVESGTEIVTVGAHLIDTGDLLKRYVGLTVEGN